MCIPKEKRRISKAGKHKTSKLILSRLCRFCEKSLAVKGFPTKTTSTCRHSPPICNACLRRHLTAAKTSSIRCPLNKPNKAGINTSVCEGLFELGDVRGILSTGGYSRYLDNYIAKHTPPPELAPEPVVDIETFDCVVCLDTLSANLLPSSKVTLTCTHNASVCKPCLRSCITVAVSDADHPTCPQCPAQFSYAEICNLADHEKLMQYDARMTLEALSGLTDFRWCLKKDCGSGQLHEGGEDCPIVTCLKCREKMCFTHNVKWHEGETCAEFQAKKDADKFEKATQEHLQKVSKPCPNISCGIRIQKSTGCDHMTCRKCQHQFCWVCLAAYQAIRTKGNKAHKIDCIYYR